MLRAPLAAVLLGRPFAAAASAEDEGLAAAAAGTLGGRLSLRWPRVVMVLDRTAELDVRVSAAR